MTLEETITSLTAGQSLQLESITMVKILTWLDAISTFQQVLDELVAVIANINLDQFIPPHNDQPDHGQADTMNRPLQRTLKPSFSPMPPIQYRIDSPSGGACARVPFKTKSAVIIGRKIQENMKSKGESKLLRQFLLEIYDMLEQYAGSFSFDKCQINWIVAHFSTSLGDISLAQAWLSPLLKENAHVLDIIDPYANLTSL